MSMAEKLSKIWLVEMRTAMLDVEKTRRTLNDL